MEFLRSVNEMVNSGDPIVRQLPLIRQTYTPFALCFLYVLFSTVVGPVLMKNRKPFDLRKVLIAFNFSIVAVYVGTLTFICYHLPQVTWEEFCKAGAIKEGAITHKLLKVGWYIYLLKYIEFFDTAFFILRKKFHLVTFLHVVHHTVVPLIAWFVLRTEKNGFLIIPALLNTFVHVIMYTYYGLAAMGPEVRKYLWWKKYLTQMQIVQFVLMLVSTSVVAPLLGCPMLLTSKFLNYFFVPFFLILFLNFYINSFVTSRTNKSNGASHGIQNGKHR